MDQSGVLLDYHNMEVKSILLDSFFSLVRRDVVRLAHKPTVWMDFLLRRDSDGYKILGPSIIGVEIHCSLARRIYTNERVVILDVEWLN